MASRPPDARVGDRAQDDWLGDQGEVSWDDTRGQTEGQVGDADRPDARASPTSATAAAAAPRAETRRLEVVQRRRAIAAVALLGLALVGVGVGLTVIRDDAPSTETTTPTVATPPPPATPPATTSTTPEPPAPALTVELPADGRLAFGDRGDEVETLQTALAALDFQVGEADGIYGDDTKAAVVAFQEANGLTADGIVGPETVRELNAALAEQGVTG